MAIDPRGAVSLELAAQRNGASQADLRRLGRQAIGPTTQESSERWVQWGDMASVLGQPFDSTVISLAKLEQMRRDPMLAFGMMFIKVPIIRATWYIKCEDARVAAAIDGALRPVYGRYVLAYTNSLDYGFSPIVKRFELITPDWKFLDKDNPEAIEQLVWPDKKIKMLAWKAPLTLDPKRARPAFKNGEFHGIHYSKMKSSSNSFSMNKVPEIPAAWALWATNERESVFGSIYGFPLLGYAYPYWWDYWFKFRMAERAFERWADPPIEIYHPAETGVDNSTGEVINSAVRAQEIAQAYRSGANITFPSTVVTGYDERTTNTREWQAKQMETTVDFQAIRGEFEYLDVMKLRALAVPEQALIEGKGGTSSRNVAAVGMDTFQEAQAVRAAEFADQMNRWVIPQLVEMNFGSAAPKAELVISGFDQQDTETMRDVIRFFGQTDPTTLHVDIRALSERMGLPLMSVEAVHREVEAQARAAAATAPTNVPALGGTNSSAGVTKAGLYYEPREVIHLSERAEEGDTKYDALLLTLDQLGRRIDTLQLPRQEAVQPAPVNVDVHPQDVRVELHVPEQKPRNVRKTVLRGDNGEIIGSTEEEIQDGE